MTAEPSDTTPTVIPAQSAPIALRVRPADLHDLPQCLDIDPAFVTTYVWQLEEWLDAPDEAEPAANGRPQPQPLAADTTERRSFFAGLQPSRLPRPLAVAAPVSGRALLDEWNRTDFMAVAEMVGQTDDPTGEMVEPVGYIGLVRDVRRPLAWVTSMAVQQQRRRSGIGRALLAAAADWATRQQLGALMVELSTLNYPAVAFAQKHDFLYCGYNSRIGLSDHLRYPTPGAPERDRLSRQPRAGSGDIVLYFYLRLT